ncbi:MAG: S-layer homology domain-containing protein [Clostridia bacterium]|nr:S-layer homology domain-containing protein [Clostridia bacterium]
MKKLMSAVIAICFIFLSTPHAFAIEEKYSYDDLQRLYDTVVNYIFGSEDSIALYITEEEDALCAKSMNAAKLLLLSGKHSAEEIDTAYRGLYSAFSFLMLINQRGQETVTPQRITLLKSIAAVTLTDGFYAIVESEYGNSVRSTSAGAITVISEAASHTQEEVDENFKILCNLLYTCLRILIDNYYAPFNALVFADILPSDWYYEAVGYVYSSGLFKGTSPTEFSPSLTMTRAMFITVLYRFAYADTTPASSGYADIPLDAYYCGPVLWAKENGILDWIEGNAFLPDEPITRQEMFMCMYNYSRSVNFNDADYDFSIAEQITDLGDVSDAARDAAYWCYSTGVISGYGDNSVKPYSTATRAEVAQVFINFTEVMGAA